MPRRHHSIGTLEETARIGAIIEALDEDAPPQLKAIRNTRVEVQGLHRAFADSVDEIRTDPDLSKTGAGKRVQELAQGAMQRLSVSKTKMRQQRDALESLADRRQPAPNATVAEIGELRRDLLLDRLLRLEKDRRFELMLSPDDVEVARAVLAAPSWVQQELGVTPEMLGQLEEAALSPDVAATVRQGRKELGWLEAEVIAYERVLQAASSSDPVVEAASA